MRIIYAAIVWAYLPWVIGSVALIVLCYSTYRICLLLLERADRRKQDRLNREAELRWRADYQNNWVQRGDPLGTYGNYTPATLPLTNPYDLFGGYYDDDVR